MVEFDWEKLYGRLDEWLSKGLKAPGESLHSCQASLESVRDVSQRALLLFNRMTRYRSEAKEELLNIKSEMQFHSPIKNKESGLSERFSKMALRLEKIDSYLICLGKILSAAKDIRNDVSKKVKMVEIERNIER